ncbi:hypothetical protein CHARACLAT_030594 [Characodon lateralis]|uniref:Uncharacterized protein n=1 Tax=Characodon lateralis TaxID=208331 RepID=A0ABU7D2L6_9TELE|nr:hypothetical protein [Characodon lateralis]
MPIDISRWAGSLTRKYGIRKTRKYSCVKQRWGNLNELVAGIHYIKAMQDHHTDFQVTTAIKTAHQNNANEDTFTGLACR